MPTRRQDFEELVTRLKDLVKCIPQTRTQDFSSYQAKCTSEEIKKTTNSLLKLLADLDPVRRPTSVFDPSKPDVVARFVAIALLAQPRRPLNNVERCYGSGVYALYYKGSLSRYRPISRKEHPIYVGKADPKNPSAKDPYSQGERLSGRLNDHRKNVLKVAPALRLEDFEYRSLVVQTGWQEAAESYLLHLYQPIWNKEVGICYGFGKHGDAPTTRSNLRSPWDTLHSGRSWAHRDKKIKDAKPQSVIEAEIKTHFKDNPPFKSVGQIIKRFLDEMGQA